MYTKVTLEPKFREIIGKSIKNARRDMQMTQAELAMKLGFTEDIIVHYESGKRMIPLGSLRILCLALKLSLDDMLGLKLH